MIIVIKKINHASLQFALWGKTITLNIIIIFFFYWTPAACLLTSQTISFYYIFFVFKTGILKLKPIAKLSSQGAKSQTVVSYTIS